MREQSKSLKLKNIRFRNKLIEGTYNGYIEEIETVQSKKDGTNFVEFQCVIEDDGKAYPIKKYFVADDDSNDKLYYFLDEIGAIKSNGYVDWDEVKEYEYKMQVHIDSKSGKCKVGEINLLYEEEEDSYDDYEDDGGDYYEE